MVRPRAHRQVVIVFEHDLLGEGLAQYFRTVAGIRSRTARALDGAAVRRALSDCPEVVVVESSAVPVADVASLCPNAVLIDVSGVFTAEVAPRPAAILERILAVVGHTAQPA